DALTAYLWSWLENQVLAAMKTIPLGQVAGQKMLLALGAAIPAAVARVQQVADDDITSFAPGLAIASARRETQYSRLCRSCPHERTTASGRHRRAGWLREDRASVGALPRSARPLRNRGGDQRHLHGRGRGVPRAQRSAAGRTHHRRGNRRLSSYAHPRGAVARS